MYKYFKYFSKVMNLNEKVRLLNQTYFEWYEFDVNVALILMNQRCSEYE